MTSVTEAGAALLALGKGEDWGPSFDDFVTAVASAVAALQGRAATSSTSLSIGTGAKSFTTDQTASAVELAGTVRAYSAGDPSKYMVGTIASFTGTALDLTVTLTGGSGTVSDWVIAYEIGVVPELALDTSPQLSAELDADGNDISSAGALSADSVDADAVDAGALTLASAVSASTSYSASVTASVAVSSGVVVDYLLDADGEIDLAPAASGKAYFVVAIVRQDGTGSRDLTHKFDGATTNAFEDDGADYSTETDFAADGANVLRVVGFTVTSSRSIMSVGGALDLS